MDMAYTVEQFLDFLKEEEKSERQSVNTPTNCRCSYNF